MLTRIQTAQLKPGRIQPWVTNWLCLNHKEVEIMNRLHLVIPKGFKELSTAKGQIQKSLIYI